MDRQKILVPLDGSELAERVLLSAVGLAEQIGASLTLLTVVSPSHKDAPDPVAQAVQTHKFEAGLYLKGVRSRLLPTRVEIETAVASGSPARSIIQYARENPVTLILMSTHGRSGLNRWSFGRVAEKVLRRAPCPTVIWRSQQAVAPATIKRILIPLDGSGLAEQVLAPTQAIATALKAEIVLLQVVEPSLFPFVVEESSKSASQVQDGLAYLGTVRTRLLTKGLKVEKQVLSGPAADTIIDYAAEQAIDLIVLSSLGSSGLEMWMFGSVAERVMKGAACATLVIRPENP
jgi:nucleotide-binding universal stress UspA family protein